jgi:hypothetical protein
MIGGNIIKLGDEVVDFVNNKYRDFFTNFDKETSKSDHIGFKLFVEYDFSNKHSHNVFWCREWGYSGINCETFTEIVKKVDCCKMIIAHCPQFLANDKPKMINFECVDTTNNIDNTNNTNNTDLEKKFKIARVDLGMSRSFEYNKSDDFFKFLKYNYNRKMSVLKLSFDEKTKKYYFNYNSVITKKLSCIQYLLIKYGINKIDWDNKHIVSDWLGFEHIQNLLNSINDNRDKYQTDELVLGSNKIDKCSNQTEPNNIMLCLLYPVLNSKHNLKSVKQFLELGK